MGNLPKDQREALVDGVVFKLSEVLPDDNEIDEIIADIKTRTIDIRNQDSFNRQVKTLLDKGYSMAAGMDVEQFLEYMNPLMDKFREGDLIVIPERMVPIHCQMSRVEFGNNGKAGYAKINLGVLRQAHGINTPNVPYLIRDVENGPQLDFSSNPDNRAEWFRENGRSVLVVEEGISIVTHKPKTFKDYNIHLFGSRNGGDEIAILWLFDGRPKLGWTHADRSDLEWCSASCGSRISV